MTATALGFILPVAMVVLMFVAMSTADDWLYPVRQVMVVVRDLLVMALLLMALIAVVIWICITLGLFRIIMIGLSALAVIALFAIAKAIITRK